MTVYSATAPIWISAWKTTAPSRNCLQITSSHSPLQYCSLQQGQESLCKPVGHDHGQLWERLDLDEALKLGLQHALGRVAGWLQSKDQKVLTIGEATCCPARHPHGLLKNMGLITVQPCVSTWSQQNLPSSAKPWQSPQWEMTACPKHYSYHFSCSFPASQGFLFQHLSRPSTESTRGCVMFLSISLPLRHSWVNQREQLTFWFQHNRQLVI